MLTGSKQKLNVWWALMVFGCLLAFTGSAYAAQNMWLTDDSCAIQQKNSYNIGQDIHIRLEGLSPNTPFSWSITGQPGSCDPKTVVESGSDTLDASGYKCINAYTVAVDDCGGYKVEVTVGTSKYTKTYNVVGGTPPEGTGTISISKTVTESCSDVDFTINVTGPTEGTPETTSQIISCDNGGAPVIFSALPPGTYNITEDAVTGWRAQTISPNPVTVIEGQTVSSSIVNEPRPTPTAIPTLSEWGMILMSLVLAGSAIWMIRRRQVA